MLVLTRKKDEKILIGGGIVVTIVRIDKGRVRVGIDAPTEIPIQREELLQVMPGDAAVHSADAGSPRRTD